MKQFFEKYIYWEDYINGMYECNFTNDQEDTLIKKSIELLSDKKIFFDSALRMINDWTISSKVNLTNLNSNRRAWVGQATCCYIHRCPEFLTKKSWSYISEDKKNKANIVADKIISIYEKKNKSIHNPMANEMLF